MSYRMDDDHTRWMVCGEGGSGYTAHSFGQEAVCIAEALRRSGYTSITPVNTIGRFNYLNMWTTDESPDGPGLIDYYRLPEAYHQIDIHGNQYSLVQGVWGRFNHTLLKIVATDTYIDPYSGQEIIPAGFHPTGRVRSFSITPPTV